MRKNAPPQPPCDSGTRGSRPSERAVDTLTAREQQVVSRIVKGLLNKVVAELGISVKVHRRHIVQKMAAASLAELVLMIGKIV